MNSISWKLFNACKTVGKWSAIGGLVGGGLGGGLAGYQDGFLYEEEINDVVSEKRLSDKIKNKYIRTGYGAAMMGIGCGTLCGAYGATFPASVPATVFAYRQGYIITKRNGTKFNVKFTNNPNVK